jgi:DNA-binding GntR family transcriptional regulator
MDMVTRPASRATALVLDALRAAIVGGELSPGEQVRQQAWAERCGVSRPPVREALEILCNEGVLTHGLNQGYFVTKFSLSEMRQLYTMRHLLEREAIATIEWPTGEQIDRLRALVEDVQRTVNDRRPDLAMTSLVQFYLTIFRLSPLSLIVDEIERLWMRSAPYRYGNYDVTVDPQGTLVRFDEVIGALVARDREKLGDLLQRLTLRGLGAASSPGDWTGVDRAEVGQMS